MLTDYTTYESVRAVLGLNSRELPDALLAAEIYGLALDEDHAQISADLVADYAVAVLLTTPAAKNFVRTLRIFSTHSVAFKCVDTLPLLSSKAITDGKAGVYRDGNSPYKETMAKLEAAYSRAKRSLQEAYAIYKGTTLAEATPVNLVGVSVLAVDPVTGA